MSTPPPSQSGCRQAGGFLTTHCTGPFTPLITHSILTQCGQTADLGSAGADRSTSGTQQVLCAVHPVPPPTAGSPAEWDRAERQQAVRKLCGAPWRQETLGPMSRTVVSLDAIHRKANIFLTSHNPQRPMWPQVTFTPRDRISPICSSLEGSCDPQVPVVSKSGRPPPLALYTPSV